MYSPELLRELLERFTGPGPGLNVLIRRVHAELYGVAPTDAEVAAISRKFQDAWDEKYCPARPLPPIGAGSPHYERKGELAPGQENAIRILEDC